jgi:hypothetical protein
MNGVPEGLDVGDERTGVNDVIDSLVLACGQSRTLSLRNASIMRIPGWSCFDTTNLHISASLLHGPSLPTTFADCRCQSWQQTSISLFSSFQVEP